MMDGLASSLRGRRFPRGAPGKSSIRRWRRISGSAGAQAVPGAIRKCWPGVEHRFADAACDRLKLMDRAAWPDLIVGIIRRPDGVGGFEVLLRRVGRTFGWMSRWRRLVGDHERRIDASKVMIAVAMGGTLIRKSAYPRFSNRFLKRRMYCCVYPSLPVLPSIHLLDVSSRVEVFSVTMAARRADGYFDSSCSCYPPRQVTVLRDQRFLAHIKGIIRPLQMLSRRPYGRQTPGRTS